LDRADHAGQYLPIRAELKGHDDAGNYPHPERHAEDLQPELEHHAIGWASGRHVQGFEDGQPRRQPDRERRKNNVERDREGELQPRQE